MVTYDDLTVRLTQWAADEPDIRAALVLGSRARTDHPADAWSDLDILVFATEIERFVWDSSWATSIAPHWLTFVERTGDGQSWERRTLYAGGLDVDVAFFPAAALDLGDGELPATFADVMRRGVRVLIDKDGRLAGILKRPLPTTPLNRQPDAAEFANAVSDFWYHTPWCAKHLRRGELWWAKSGIDMHLKGYLQRMLEWHARATRGDSHDTWLRGRFLEEWADPRAVTELSRAFAHYEAADMARALAATMSLYRWLEDETVAVWGYPIPRAGELAAEAATRALLDAGPWRTGH